MRLDVRQQPKLLERENPYLFECVEVKRHERAAAATPPSRGPREVTVLSTQAQDVLLYDKMFYSALVDLTN